MVRPAERSNLSAAAYLAWERLQPTRHEYFRGDVFAMAGGSPRHNALGASLTAMLYAALADKGCHVLSSDQRIGFPGGDRYVYADVTVVCGAVELQAGTSDVLINPEIIIEILSASTEPYDRGLKWEGYQGIVSLVDYVLVSQAEPRIEHFRRDANSGTWIYRATGLGGHVTLTNGTVIEVDRVFRSALELPGD
jgi:Uma2 family endonuclease